jgi:hypothetical protein
MPYLQNQKVFFATLFSQFWSSDSWLGESQGKFPFCQIVGRCGAVQLELADRRAGTDVNFELQ